MILSPYFHSFVDVEEHHHHHENEHHCSAELEQDACHRRIVHHDLSAECHHDGHLAEQEKHCEVCDWLVTRNQVEPTKNSNHAFLIVSSVRFFEAPLELCSSFNAEHKGRAPPAWV